MDLFGFSSWPSDPFDTLDRMRRDMDAVFQRWGREALPARGQVHPPVNLYETEDGYVLTAELPGLRHGDLEVSIEGNRVTLRGERKIEYPEDAGLHRRERQAGIFRRVLELPVEVESEKAEATYKHGVLMLRLPKAERHRPRQISVSRR